MILAERALADWLTCWDAYALAPSDDDKTTAALYRAIDRARALVVAATFRDRTAPMREAVEGNKGGK